MKEFFEQFVLIICSVLASSGFWAIIQKKISKKDYQSELLIGLAHDRIIQSGMYYIKRGYITRDEYENLHDYLYVPYSKMGGNGSATHVMERVDKLEIRDHVTEE